MKLFAYAVANDPPPIVPAKLERGWMDQFPGRIPYRCLPLAIANTHGWDILCPMDIEIIWNGGNKIEDLIVQSPDGQSAVHHIAMSHFSGGIVTFHTNYLFQTEESWQLMASGPANSPKDGIYALTGLIESDWLPMPFTMNWQMTRPGRVKFLKGEPYCTVFPIQQAIVEQTTPVIYDLAQNRPLFRDYELWRDNRTQFLKNLKDKDPDAVKRSWEKHYFLGKDPRSGDTVLNHVNRQRLDKPQDRRRTGPVRGVLLADKIREDRAILESNEPQ